MAKVFVRKIGGARETAVAETVADLGVSNDYVVTVNGEVASPATELKDGDFITMAKNVDGNAVLLQLKGIILTYDGKAFYLNGEMLTKAKAIKVATAIATALDIDIK